MKGKALALVAAAVVVLLATVETGAALTAKARVAPPSDWSAAANVVKAGLEPGDLIVFAPRWVDQVGRSHLGDLIPVEMAARADADRYARVWEVSIRGARADETRDARLVREELHGRVRVALYEKPAVHVLWDFSSHAADARVTQSLPPAGDETICPHAELPTAYRCAGTRVEQRTLEIDYQPRRGLLTPADGVRTTHVTYDEVPLGNTLRVYGGIHDYYARKRGDGWVDFTISIDGKERVHALVGNGDGWRAFDVDTAALAGGRHQVRFDVSARSPEWRSFGFHAEARQ